MKLSRKFLADYVDITVSTKTLAENMTKIGNEYDKIYDQIIGTNLVIGKVISCINHPDSDHLHVCKVDIKDEVLDIVCGASNVKENIKVIVAKNGAVLKDITIKPVTIRGVPSNGMICSLMELGIEAKYLTEEQKQGIHILNDDAPLGEDPVKYLELDDSIIDFELTANRGDLLSVLGMAYEVGALYSKEVKPINLSYNEEKEDIKDSFKLEVQTEDCSLFLIKKATNIIIKESPTFIKNRLMASGIRPINNVVDISNYVMLETGQPLHFYDADKLGDNLVVRMALNNEELITLDDIKRTLTSDDIVIANNKNAIGLAGVMGGISTEVDENTKNVIIESAIFDPVKVRYTSKKILRSEASLRFEKGLDKKRCYMAIDRACHLLQEHASGKILSGLISYDKNYGEDKNIEITLDKIKKVLGFEITIKEVIDVFNRLGFTSKVNNTNIIVTVPSRRTDIAIKEDLIEEVGRIYGVDNITSKLPTIPVKPGYVNKVYRDIRNKLISLGLNETLTYTLINPKDVHKYTTDDFEEVKVLDPMTEERSALRYSLIPSLLKVFEYNKARNIKDISIFEIGKSFYKKDNEYFEYNKLSAILTGKYLTGLNNNKDYDFYIVKGIIEELLNYLGYPKHYFEVNSAIPKELHPYQSASIVINNQTIGYFGILHPNISKDNVYVLEINLQKLFENYPVKMKYQEISKYPSISKDLAFVIDKSINAEDIIKTINSSGKYLKKVTVFDIYTGINIDNDSKSLAFNLVFESKDKTLTEEEINNSVDSIIKKVIEKHNAILRDK